MRTCLYRRCRLVRQGTVWADQGFGGMGVQCLKVGSQGKAACCLGCEATHAGEIGSGSPDKSQGVQRLVGWCVHFLDMLRSWGEQGRCLRSLVCCAS